MWESVSSIGIRGGSKRWEERADGLGAAVQACLQRHEELRCGRRTRWTSCSCQVKNQPRAEATGTRSWAPGGEVLCSPERTPGIETPSMGTRSPGQEFNQGHSDPPTGYHETDHCGLVADKMFISRRVLNQTRSPRTTGGFISL